MWGDRVCPSASFISETTPRISMKFGIGDNHLKLLSEFDFEPDQFKISHIYMKPKSNFNFVKNNLWFKQKMMTWNTASSSLKFTTLIWTIFRNNVDIIKKCLNILSCLYCNQLHKNRLVICNKWAKPLKQAYAKSKKASVYIFRIFVLEGQRSQYVTPTFQLIIHSYSYRYLFDAA
jgi:hypothetical protein